ncbi:LapA family protein [Gemmobacter lutimaris]|uniref:LapA family protein n=1 Tax=Gemmobacter lutimaris TaxID=2306023 RepID=A0A398BXA4_9RHOB|nr:LapA family protein [Gemmobacter lutimaris]
MRYLRYLVLLVIGLALLTIAFANRAAVQVSVLPADVAQVAGWNWQAEVPLFVAIFGGVAVGLLIGFVWEWLREHRHRRVASTKTAEAQRLERELAAMRDAKGQPQDDVMALLDKKA